jgi:hypothetical protein
MGILARVLTRVGSVLRGRPAAAPLYGWFNRQGGPAARDWANAAPRYARDLLKAGESVRDERLRLTDPTQSG